MADPQAKILVAEDDSLSRQMLFDVLSAAGYSVRTVADGAEAWLDLREHPVDLLLSDLCMPSLDGMDLLRLLEEVPDRPAFIMFTAYGTVGSAIEATKTGAYGYLAKPVNPERLLALVAQALAERRLEAENHRLHHEIHGHCGADQVIGTSPGMVRIRALIDDLATSEARVLLLGKSGTGKEVVARAIHAVSPRRKAAFVALNCGGLSETLLESELFGHVKGAFTGAVQSRGGMMQAAHKGTLFLDEIGDMPLAVQGKLLRALEVGTIRPVGADQGILVDVRVLAATHRDLEAAVAAGLFREDLYYRLNVIAIRLPDLAARREDIPALAAHFIAEACGKCGRTPPALAAEAVARLHDYRWPGNVRELRNVLERALALTPGPEITAKQLPSHLWAGTDWSRVPGSLSLQAIEAQAITRALAQAQQNRAQAATLLGISERSLYRKLRRHRLMTAPGVPQTPPSA
jgi:DNA-binding NtrC family response regulator